MSIDARVETVVVLPNGTGRLMLVDRPPFNGGYPGIAGQDYLLFDERPASVNSLRSLDIWGNASTIMLGDRKIAERIGYTRIKFVSESELAEALRAVQS